MKTLNYNNLKALIIQYFKYKFIDNPYFLKKNVNCKELKNILEEREI